ncbi:MaoC family dehydratase N-terminal domain-containing protein [Salinibacterium sp. SYSU T00001]|uniref:FAS1-like dehydratase domain-containing protein n=1 Tax=Homoserinimonas sedimenticola TaxID=2986805 RepID=UPI002235EFD0|nr:MaoC family dehydratase N-terminal domain-containing protein [Salinibacterium sedimenticola]MCW4385364.1 MaoC family dehydratase N-terminal domain-containing protein [Salinibacterium sedimenticola]
MKRESVIGVETAAAYAGTFAPDEQLALGDLLPPAWEGVYFPFAVPLADLRADGTPARDGVIPEIDLPRRMYAGEDTEFLSELRLGDTVTQETRLGEVTEKNGRGGRLMFVDIVREYSVDGGCAIRSTWHDVFLEQADPSVPAREPKRDTDAASNADWIDEVRLDIRQLFRFSALTFNTHLVHYDRAWAQQQEGLPDLLVHGPLTRILLMDSARRHRPDARPTSLSVRAVAPTLVDRRVRIAGTAAADVTSITALDDDDVVLATAEISWSTA